MVGMASTGVYSRAGIPIMEVELYQAQLMSAIEGKRG